MALMRRLTLVVAAMLGVAVPAAASGPFFAEAVFVSDIARDPADPTGFYEGRLGIIQTGQQPAYYVAAWRALNGKPFSKDQALVAMQPCCDIGIAIDAALEEWDGARSLVDVPAPSQDIQPYRMSKYSPGEVVRVICSADAFNTAARTLRQRIQDHGPDDNWVKTWLAGQDSVFQACSGQKADWTPLDAGAPDWLVKDRAYQVAAANFYGDDFDQALSQFRAIALDNESPWRAVAPYLVARILFRAGQYEQARTQIDQVLLDPIAAPYHDAARNLLLRIVLQEGQGERIALARRLEQRLSITDATDLLAEDISDYWRIGAMKFLPMGRWMLSYSATQEWSGLTARDDWPAMIAAWRAEPSLAWLAAAMSAWNGDAQGAEELIVASKQVDRLSPGYAHVTYYRIWMLISLGRIDQARAELDAVDTKAPSINGAARNEFLGLRMRVARTAEEFFRAAPRRALYFFSGYEGIYVPPIKRGMNVTVEIAWREEAYHPNPVYLDGDAVAAFNFCLPLSSQIALLRGQNWPVHLRRQLAVFVFTRAVVLHRSSSAVSLAADVAAALPELQELATAIGAAQSDEERKFLLALMLLRLPGSSISLRSGLGYRIGPTYIGDYDPRWWSKEDTKQYASGEEESGSSACGIPFIPSQAYAAARAERTELAKLADAPVYLGGIVLDYAARHPADPRVPQALHYVVRATQYGEPNADISRRAFTALHRRFPADPWTKKTPFWYGNRSMGRG